jgi:hypothetical protein
MDIFYASTTITVGNGKKTPFWEAPWLGGRKPKDIAPLIFDTSRRKRWNVNQALNANAWVSNIKLGDDFSMDHFAQFIDLWVLCQDMHLVAAVDDDITWNLTASGIYSAKSAYEVQFLGSVTSFLHKSVWKAWAPPKAKFFAWLLTQNRIWTADRLQKRGWPNCGLCPLCKQTMETANHLFIHCRFSTRLWEKVAEWLHNSVIQPGDWVGLSIELWWRNMTNSQMPNRKALSSLALLDTWELWNERNARVFNNKHATVAVILEKIKNEARLWVTAGAKHLGKIMPGE